MLVDLAFGQRLVVPSQIKGQHPVCRCLLRRIDRTLEGCCWGSMQTWHLRKNNKVLGTHTQVWSACGGPTEGVLRFKVWNTLTKLHNWGHVPDIWEFAPYHQTSAEDLRDRNHPVTHPYILHMTINSWIFNLKLYTQRWVYITSLFSTYNKEVEFPPLCVYFVCVFVSRIMQKSPNWFAPN